MKRDLKRPFTTLIGSPSCQSDLTFLVDLKNGDQIIKQSLYSVMAKYCDLSVSRRSIVFFGLRPQQIIDVFDADKLTGIFGYDLTCRMLIHLWK